MDGMKKIGTIRYKDNKYANVFMFGSFGFFVLVGGALVLLSGVRERNAVESQWFLAGCLCYILLHELTHICFMKLFSKESIRISVQFPTISVGSDGKFSKTQFRMIALAPVIVLGLILAICLLLFSEAYTFLFSVLLILNFAGSGGDYLQWYVMGKYPANAYFQDNGDETAVYQDEPR